MQKSIYFVVDWGPNKQRAWSGTNYGLYSALKKRMNVCDIDTTAKDSFKSRLLRKVHILPRDMGMEHISIARNIAKNAIAKNGKKDAVFQFSEIIPDSLGMPTYIYLDLSVDRVRFMHDNNPDEFKVSTYQTFPLSIIVKRGAAKQIF